MYQIPTSRSAGMAAEKYCAPTVCKALPVPDVQYTERSKAEVQRVEKHQAGGWLLRGFLRF